MNRLAPSVLKLWALAALVTAAGAAGCATEQKVLRTPYYTLNHPEYWKVKAVASKPGEQSKLSIGRYSTSVMTGSEETGASDSIYETSMADVDVRIVAWPDPGVPGEASEQVGQLLWDDADLQLGKHGRLAADSRECGREFLRKFTLFGAEQMPLDLLKRPGWRTVVVGGKSGGMLVGVVARVPYEQDPGLFCHNRNNLHLQLQNVLDALKINPGSMPAPTPAAAAPPGAAPGAGPAGVPPAETPPAPPSPPSP